MKTTRTAIRKNTRSTEVETGSMGRTWDHFYKHPPHEAFELKHSEPAVMHHYGPNTNVIGYARTKKEFVEIVYSHLNQMP